MLEFLPVQYRACSGRLACRDAWRHLSGVHHRTAHLSQRLPPHAVPWFERYGPEALKQLPFDERLLLPMAAAAASGSEANLAAVWGMVRQGFLPELLQCYEHISIDGATHLGSVMVREGHAQLLPWLLDSGYPVYPNTYDDILCTAAHHCDLAGLQAVWQVVQPHFHRIPTPKLTWRAVLNKAAASSAREDAIAKVSWLVRQGPYRPVGPLPRSVALAAIRADDIPRLQWALQQGCDLGTHEAMTDTQKRYSDPLAPAMRHAGLELVEWLLREAGCQLPQPLAPEAAYGDGPYPDVQVLGGGRLRLSLPREACRRRDLAVAAAESGDVAKLRWLRDRGLLLLEPKLATDHVEAAARQGRLEALRYLHAEYGQKLSPGVVRAALGSGDVGTAAWVLQQGGGELLGDRGAVCWAAASSGNEELLRWMVDQGMVGAGEELQAVHGIVAGGRWSGEVRQWQQQRESMMSAIRLVFEAAGDRRSSNGGGDSSGGGGGRDGGSGGGGGGRVAAASERNKALGEKLLEAAAKLGSLPLFTYLHSQLQLQLQCHPLLPTVQCVEEAVECGSEALVEWLLGRACGCAPEGPLQLFLLDAGHGDLATLRCLRRMGLPWPDRLLPEAVACEVPLPMLQWLVEEGAPTDEECVMEAIGWAVDMENARTGKSQEERDETELETWLFGLAFELEASGYTESEEGGGR